MQAEYVQEWFVVADRDIAAADYLATMHPQPYEIICYHCQQAVEKYLKAFLLSNDIKPPHSHDLEQLCNMCQSYEPAFSEIQELCSVLTQYGSQSRYPSEIEVHERHMLQALSYAQQVKEFTPLGTLRSELNYKLNELLDAERNGPSMSY